MLALRDCFFFDKSTGLDQIPDCSAGSSLGLSLARRRQKHERPVQVHAADQVVGRMPTAIRACILHQYRDSADSPE
jgi:hypothetical protein